MEELASKSQEEDDAEVSIVAKRGEEWFVRATAPIADVNEHLPRPIPEAEEYETIGGWINHTAGRIPELNEVIRADGYDCTITQRSKRSIEYVKRKLADEDLEDDVE